MGAELFERPVGNVLATDNHACTTVRYIRRLFADNVSTAFYTDSLTKAQEIL